MRGTRMHARVWRARHVWVMCARARAQTDEIPMLSHHDPLPEGPVRFTNEYGMTKIMFRVKVSARAATRTHAHIAHVWRARAQVMTPAVRASIADRMTDEWLTILEGLLELDYFYFYVVVPGSATKFNLRDGIYSLGCSVTLTRPSGSSSTACCFSRSCTRRSRSRTCARTCSTLARGRCACARART